MIWDKFEKVKQDFGFCYVPLCEDYIFSDEYKKERMLYIEVPKEIKCKKAVPFLFTTSNSFNKLSEDSKLKAINIFFKSMYRTSGSYPYSFKIEVKKGKFVRFTLADFYTLDLLDSPVVRYTVGGVSK